jgi:ubiquinone/menaquinone biosynthesis C-methylase UbiE/uncharacterized protein YbaR (Trm112 family)
MILDAELLNALADPVDHSPLVLSVDALALHNARAGRSYPIIDGIPVLTIPETARPDGHETRYDELAGWYDGEMGSGGSKREFSERGDELLRALLGPGEGRALDLACGTGRTADLVRGLGYHPLGVDISRGQLGIARSRLPAVCASAQALPLRDSGFAAVYTTFSTASLENLEASVREIHRVLSPGGRTVNIGVHPCFNGSCSESRPNGSVLARPGYRRSGWFAPAHFRAGSIRSRTGAWHYPLADVINAYAAAGFRLNKVEETGPGGPDALPLIFGLAATKA